MRTYPCQCNETLNRLSAAAVKAKGPKATLNVFADAVAVLEREPIRIPGWLYFIIRVVQFMVSIPFLVVSMPFACALGVVSLFLAGIVFMGLHDALSHVFGRSGGLVAALTVMGVPLLLLIGVTFLGRRWSWWARFVTRLIRNKPTAWYAIALLHRYTPLIPRLFRRGDVVQLIRCEAKTGWLSGRSLLAFVQDRPLRRRPSLLDVLALPIFPRRRIYYVALDGGEDTAEEAARATAEALGIEISRASFHKRKGMQLV